MTNIQMILALGAMILLTILITNVNKNSLNTEDVMYDSNFGITATSIASSIIEDASKKYFDNYSDTTGAAININDLTAPDDLGIETGEDLTDPRTFNDFDDYKNYAKTENSMPTAIFHLSCDVYYVDLSDPDLKVNYRTWHKKITVKVWSESMKDTISMSQIYSYWTDIFN